MFHRFFFLVGYLLTDSLPESEASFSLLLPQGSLASKSSNLVSKGCDSLKNHSIDKSSQGDNKVGTEEISRVPAQINIVRLGAAKLFTFVTHGGRKSQFFFRDR